MKYICIFILQNLLQINLGLPDNTEKMMKFDNGGCNEKVNRQTYLCKYIYTDEICHFFCILKHSIKKEQKTPSYIDKPCIVPVAVDL